MTPTEAQQLLADAVVLALAPGADRQLTARVVDKAVDLALDAGVEPAVCSRYVDLLAPAGLVLPTRLRPQPSSGPPW
jgi:hypothetical protein